MKWTRKAVLLLLAALLSGCASAMNPFESGYKCSATDTGECIPINEAYEAALKVEKKGNQDSKIKGDDNSTSGKKDLTKAEPGKGGRHEDPSVRYKDMVYEKAAETLEEPKAPIVVPPKVVRVLVLPYKSRDNTLYMQRYLYFFADEPTWIFDVQAE